ncbi:hypothetical protein PMLGA01_120065300 [Plasmodium malariae]|uniref:Uncharacterized protein n=1 Tax=Plasmodium malariae TaxID=5858 RepID=A0A1C3L1Z4_PLAMA|nr:hypothetical protein PMLGA01_120065300 [Plasmodium malariae]
MMDKNSEPVGLKTKVYTLKKKLQKFFQSLSFSFFFPMNKSKYNYLL